MPTHISIYKGNAAQVASSTSAPTTRENAEYLVENNKDLQDGDWYFNTNTNSLGVYIGTTWYYVSFGFLS